MPPTPPSLPNFLHPCMQSATVRASCLSSDDHCAQNLLAPPQSAPHRRGFVAYSVVRPPIHLDFRLHTPIQLHCLQIWTRVGCLRTTSLEVSVRAAPASASAQAAPDFVRIGVVNDLPATVNGVVFRNRRLNGAAGADQTDDQRAASLLEADFFRCLHPRMAVRELRIGIRQTHQRCAAALGEVRIIGQPAGWCVPAAECLRLQSLWAARPVSFGFYGSQSTDEPSSADAEPAADALTSSATVSAAAAAEPQPIPEAFLDDITCDLMQLPMTLPSGKCVDRSTLERLELSAASWAQQVCDPFSGMPFTGTRRPLLNAALKSQIDGWLVRHQDRADVRQLPRTVGFGVAVAGPAAAAEGQMKRRGWGEPMAAAKRPRQAGDADEAPAPASGASCGDCGAGQAALLYRLQTCEHFVCRSCLVAERRMKRCGRCGAEFERTDVRRYHDVVLG